MILNKKQIIILKGFILWKWKFNLVAMHAFIYNENIQIFFIHFENWNNISSRNEFFFNNFIIRWYEMEYSKSNKTFLLDVIALKVNEIYSNNDTNKLFVTKWVS